MGARPLRLRVVVGVEETLTLTIRYVERPHWNASNPRMKSYEVYVDGVHVGHIDRATESTDRHAGRIRIPGKGRLAWAWYNPFTAKRNSPGLYASNRIGAVRGLLGIR